MQDHNYKKAIKVFLNWTIEIRLNIHISVIIRTLPARNLTVFTRNIYSARYACRRGNRVAKSVLSEKLIKAFPLEKEMVLF